ncbi:hypothetical protein CYLTODRAFT_460749, partial [Cylindrobasidium torrendii FP15055 ss-10]
AVHGALLTALQLLSHRPRLIVFASTIRLSVLGNFSLPSLPQDRAHYAKNGIALPLPEHCTTWDKVCEWKNLPDEEFMEQYGNKKMELYRVPTEAQVAQLDINMKLHQM